jgi:hypothetical protein
MKSPMNQRPDSEARDMTEEFIGRYARKKGTLAAGKRSKTKAKA